METTVKCPLCGKGEVPVFEQPAVQRLQTRRGSAVNKTTRVFVPGKLEVKGNCSVCGASVREVRERLANPAGVPSRSQVLERLTKAGLPTVLRRKD